MVAVPVQVPVVLVRVLPYTKDPETAGATVLTGAAIRHLSKQAGLFETEVIKHHQG
jgi:hypothetical protein